MTGVPHSARIGIRMVNFKKGDLINMMHAWDKEKRQKTKACCFKYHELA